MNINTTTPEQVLHQYFAFKQFNRGQREVIEKLLEGKSVAALFPTGGGKSLCYQLPALILPGLTLVISPLIALMKDQIDSLKKRGIAAARLDSTLDIDGYRKVLSDARSGELQLLYVAPERFNNERFRQTIEQLRISLFAVDEAHCISEWGHNFRPDYLKLAEYARRCGAERILALTATATPKVEEDICQVFAIATEDAIRTGFYRPNLTVLTTRVQAQHRDQLLLNNLRERPAGAAIIYVTLQHTATEVAARLVTAGLPAKAYHAGMKNEDRSAVQEWFMRSDNAVVVATIAFGMGVDKANIRYVYHYNLPKSLENFAQEIGRAGRDGETSICEMLVCTEDLNVLENFIYGDSPDAQALVSLVNAIFSLGEHFDVSVNELSAQHDIRLLVIRTLLTYLELEGYLQGGTPVYSVYQFKPLMDSKTILSHFSGDRRDLLSQILSQARKAKTWFHIDLDQTARTIKQPRQRIVRALDYLGEKGMLELRASKVRLRYQRLKTPARQSELAIALHQRTLNREQAELFRLQQVLDLVDLNACQVGALAIHFGDELKKPCGHCSWCLPKKRLIESTDEQTQDDVIIDEDLIHQALVLQKTKPDVLSDTRSLARLLCGVTSPKLSRARLSSHELFGTLAKVPFKEVIKRFSSVEILPK